MKTRNPVLLFLGAIFALIAFLCLAPIVRGAVQKPINTVTFHSVSGGSMGPQFATPHIVAFVPLPYEKLKSGMWVARAIWDAQGKVIGFTCHRTKYKDGPLWVLKGDYNAGYDVVKLSPDNFWGVLCDPSTMKPL